MRIKRDVEFVKRECESYPDAIDWDDDMEEYCGKTVSEVKNISDQKVKCSFPDGTRWSYTPACLEEDIVLEKGKRYTVNGSNHSFEFVEESANYAIFEGGIVFEKFGNTFTELDQKPRFLKEEWKATVEDDRVLITCGPFRILSIREGGCSTISSLPKSLDLPIDDDGAVKVVE